jgi:hypothetical protein
MGTATQFLNTSSNQRFALQFATKDLYISMIGFNRSAVTNNDPYSAYPFQPADSPDQGSGYDGLGLTGVLIKATCLTYYFIKPGEAHEQIPL